MRNGMVFLLGGEEEGEGGEGGGEEEGGKDNPQTFKSAEKKIPPALSVKESSKNLERKEKII